DSSKGEASTRPTRPSRFPTMSNQSTRGARRWRWSKRVVPMRRVAFLISSAALACAAPAYRAPEVPVPAAYDVTRPTASSAPQVSDARVSDESAGAVHISESLAATPFWTSLGDSVLTALVGEAQRANLDVRVAESRLSGARASRRLSRLDRIPTITGTGSSSRLQNSLAQTPGLSSQLPAYNLYDVG